MAALTDDRQYRLGLGMLAADRRSGLTQHERRVALRLLADEAHALSPLWQYRVQSYLDARHLSEEERRGSMAPP